MHKSLPRRLAPGGAFKWLTKFHPKIMYRNWTHPLEQRIVFEKRQPCAKINIHRSELSPTLKEHKACNLNRKHTMKMWVPCFLIRTRSFSFLLIVVSWALLMFLPALISHFAWYIRQLYIKYWLLYVMLMYAIYCYNYYNINVLQIM